MLSRRITQKIFLNQLNFLRCSTIKFNLNYNVIQSRNIILSRCKIIENPNRITQFVRYKYDSKNSKKSKKKEEEEDDDEEDVSDDFDELIGDKGTKTVKTSVNSMRMDLLLRAGLGIARNKIEVAFYEHRIRLNGKKVMKKSINVKVGDEIDLIKGESAMNPEHLVIGKIEILSAVPKEDSITVTMKRFKSLTVEKYED